MSFKENIREELEKSPLTVVATVVGVFVAFLALLVAWLQYAGPTAVSSQGVTTSVPLELQLSNLLVLISFFLAASFSSASLIRMLERSHPFPAMVLSVPTAVLASFSTLVIIKLTPPRSMTPELFATAQDVVYWSTLFVFVALNGRSIALDIASPNTSGPHVQTPALSEKKESDGLGMLVALLVMLAIWGGLVSAGLSKLTQLFLI